MTGSAVVSGALSDNWAMETGAVSGGAAAGTASTACVVSTGSTTDRGAACGSQAWHSRTEGGISRPHSGQIQWNMTQMYTVMECMPFRDTPYRTHLGTLALIGIQSQGKFKGHTATGPTRLVLKDCLSSVVARRAHHTTAGMGPGAA